jgi:hypothetical protein
MTKKEIVVLIILIFIAVLRLIFFHPQIPNYQDAINKSVSVTGVVTDTPDVRLTSKRLTVSLKIKRQIFWLLLIGILIYHMVMR